MDSLHSRPYTGTPRWDLHVMGCVIETTNPNHRQISKQFCLFCFLFFHL